MTKWQNDLMLDAALDYLRTNVDKVVLCTQQPTTYTEAYTTYKLAEYTPTFGAIADGDTSGRKLTVPGATGVSPSASGDGTHIALVKTGDTTLRYVTTCPTTTVAVGINIDLNAWDIELADPA